jgi:aerobic-type carbon monoxide dehydrogenase small subunit (CoxS/CutS family)
VATIEEISPDSSHPVQKGWLAETVSQYGYCQSSQIMSAADLLNCKEAQQAMEQKPLIDVLGQGNGSQYRCFTSAAAGPAPPPRIFRCSTNKARA